MNVSWLLEGYIDVRRRKEQTFKEGVNPSSDHLVWNRLKVDEMKDCGGRCATSHELWTLIINFLHKQ